MNSHFSIRRAGMMFLLAITILPCPGLAQSYSVDAVSREVGIFNNGLSNPGIEAVSREVSLFNAGLYSFDVNSREISVFNFGVNQLTLTVGSTALQAGNSGTLPVILSTLAPITNVQFTVGFPPNLLTNWSASPGIYATNGNSLHLAVNPPDSHSFFTTQQLSQISFLAISNQPSAFLPLIVTGVTGLQIDGTDTPMKSAQNGEVVVIRTNPLLRPLLGPNGQRNLALYGLPNTNYTIESTTNLNSPVTWTPTLTTTLSNVTLLTGDVGRTNPVIFYRVRQ